MAKINEYPQAATINNNDLFVIDQENGGDHATKSASVAQIADKATSGVQSQIGSLATLTTTDKSSLVGAVNEVDGKTKWTRFGNYSGSDSADISSIFATANELKITARNYTSGQLGSSQVYTVIVGTNEITDFLSGGFTELHYLEGMNNGQSNVIDFTINSTTIRIATFLLNGNDVKSNSNTGFKVYYR